MSKKAWGVLVGIFVFLGMVGTVWAVSSYWHSYCAIETMHEVKQDEDIELALNQGKLTLYQQRQMWLQQRIDQLQREHGCPSCSGINKTIYEDYIKEYKLIQEKIKKLLGG